MPHRSVATRWVVPWSSRTAGWANAGRRAVGVVAVRVAERDRPGLGLRRVEEAGAFVRVPLRAEFAYRYAGHVADVAVAVGERGGGRLTQPVQVLPLVGGRQRRSGPVVGLEQVQGLTDRDPARGRDGHSVDVQAAVAALDGFPRPGPVVAQVGLGDLTGIHRDAGLGRRLLGGLHHGGAQPASIQRLDAVAAQDPIRPGEIGVAERRTDRRGLPAGQVDPLGFGERREPGSIRGGLGVERAVHDKAVPGQLLGRAQQPVQAPAAEPFPGGLPQGRGAGDPDGQAGIDDIW